MVSSDNSSTLIRSIVLGAAGYSGAELAVILARNPYFQLVGAYASAGRSAEPFSALYPRYKNQLDILVEPWLDEQVADLAGKVDVAFLALPHEASEAVTPLLLQQGIDVVDLSGAFRLKQADLYPK
ncbi:MAG TPA: N-acetyl-gamma-glutamyl-phosphate reductase, partial [Rheinheimera sp.]|nr:N-acetyl-gamma-glutamyl-phosphate reductase [Rheinheimera sp.]